MLKKFFLALPILILLSFFAVKPAFADSELTEYCNTRNGNVINLETWYSGKCFKGGIVGNIAGKITGGDTALTGQYRGFSDIVMLDFQTKLFGETPVDFTQIFSAAPQNQDSAIGTLSNMIARIASSPPASSTDYVAGVINNIQKHSNIVQPAYAASAGVGFTGLQPVLKAWQGLRNIAYAAYILVFVLYGFMIMFRIKIDPKVVTSFQMAIPKLIVTLILITFSYAIAGLMIDLMYVLSLGIGTALESAGLIQFRNILGAQLKAQDMLTGNGWGFFGFGLLTIAKIFLSDAIDQIIALVTSLPTTLVAVLTFGSGISLIIKLVMGIAMLYILVKIFFVFIQSYAKIVLSIIFAPVILLGNVLPGNDAFGTWARGLFAELSVFPTTLIMMMIGSTFIDTGFFGLGGGNSPVTGNLWTPPGFGGPLTNVSVLGIPLTNTGAGVGALLGFAMLMLAPKVADMVRDALKVPAFKYGGALEEPLKWAPTGILGGQKLLNETEAGRRISGGVENLMQRMPSPVRDYYRQAGVRAQQAQNVYDVLKPKVPQAQAQTGK